MKTSHQRAFLLILTIFTMMLSLFTTATVFADDELPPVEPVATEVSVVTDTLPLAEETSAMTADQTSPEPAPASEVLEQIPEDVQVVVLDEDGEVLPLATQDAAEFLIENDPMWCPAGEIPGDAGCTASYATVRQLIANLGSKSGAGTIYFTSTYSIGDAAFNHNDPNLASLTDLTIQGGWNGLTGGSYLLSGSTTFNNGHLIIYNWVGSVTINDVIVNGASSDGLSVYTLDEINLHNVQSNNNTSAGSGARLDNCGGFDGMSCTGTGDVNLTGTNSFNGNDLYGLIVDSNGNINVNNITANNNVTNMGAGLDAGVLLDNSYGSGSVTLTGYNMFIGNHGAGLYIYSKGDIALTNITANENDSGAYLDNFFSGGTGDIQINGTNNFNTNHTEGLYILSNGNITLSNINANNNSSDGVFLDTCLWFGCTDSGNIILTGKNEFNNNEGTGLFVSGNNLMLNNVIANENGVDGLNIWSNGGSTILNNITTKANERYGTAVICIFSCSKDSTVTLTGINIFNNNGFVGLDVSTNGNFYATGINIFNNNEYGLSVALEDSGDINLTNVTANGNALVGAYLQSYGNGNITVTCSTFNYNDWGIYLNANPPGVVTLNGVAASGNTYTDISGGMLANNPFGCNPEKPALTGNDLTNQLRLPINNINVTTSGQSTELDCTLFSGTTLVLLNGDKVTFKCPIEGSGSLTTLTVDTLPGNLPEGMKYVSGIQVNQSPDGSDKALDGQVIISFLISENMHDTNLAILYWDGSQWVDLKSASFEDGRVVINGGYVTNDGYFEAVTNFSGNFVLVKK